MLNRLEELVHRRLMRKEIPASAGYFNSYEMYTENRELYVKTFINHIFMNSELKKEIYNTKYFEERNSYNDR